MFIYWIFVYLNCHLNGVLRSDYKPLKYGTIWGTTFHKLKTIAQALEAAKSIN